MLSQSEKDELIQQLVDWIAIDSTSGSEAGFLAKLEEHFNSQGFRCQRDYLSNERWNLLCLEDNLEASGEAAQKLRLPRLLFVTHVDCVPPFIAPKCGKVDNELAVFGRGACDTKGGIVAMAAAAKQLHEEGLHGIGFLFVVGEEVDHSGAKTSDAKMKAYKGNVDDSKVSSDSVSKENTSLGFAEILREVKQVILCEPTVNRVISAQKGLIKLIVHAKGEACHSAYPERGDSAINHLLDVLEDWRKMELPTDPILGPTTVNIGIIEGGVAANVLAPSASAQILVRAVSPVDPLIKRYIEVANGRVEVDIPSKNDPVFFEPPGDVETGIVSCNTDATYLRSIAPIWLVGPGDIEVAHSDEEYITYKSLFDGVELYCKLARKVLG